MKKSRFTETQIVAALRRHEAGVSAKELCRELGISDATLYNWKAKYGGLDVPELKRTKDLEAELAQYKKMYAEVAFELAAAKALIAKKF